MRNKVIQLSKILAITTCMSLMLVGCSKKTTETEVLLSKEEVVAQLQSNMSNVSSIVKNVNVNANLDLTGPENETNFTVAGDILTQSGVSDDILGFYSAEGILDATYKSPTSATSSGKLIIAQYLTSDNGIFEFHNYNNIDSCWDYVSENDIDLEALAAVYTEDEINEIVSTANTNNVSYATLLKNIAAQQFYQNYMSRLTMSTQLTEENQYVFSGTFNSADILQVVSNVCQKKTGINDNSYAAIIETIKKFCTGLEFDVTVHVNSTTIMPESMLITVRNIGETADIESYVPDNSLDNSKLDTYIRKITHRLSFLDMNLNSCEIAIDYVGFNVGLNQTLPDMTIVHNSLDEMPSVVDESESDEE